MASYVDNIRAGRAYSGSLGGPAVDNPIRVGATRGEASVVVPLFLGHPRAGTEESLRVILTQRSLTLRTHPGETAFPGGKLDAGETAVEAAFREFHEEIGVDLRSMVDEGRAEVLAVLDPVVSKHLLSVTPVIVFLRDVRALSDLKFRLNRAEVHAIYTAPVHMFLGEDGYEYYDADITVEESTHSVRVHSWMYSTEDAHPPAGQAFRIWGLTGWILVHVAMLGYRKETAFALRGRSGLGLGDFVPGP